jgi:hypothetical protein
MVILFGLVGDYTLRPFRKGIAEHKKKSFYPSANLDKTKTNPLGVGFVAGYFFGGRRHGHLWYAVATVEFHRYARLMWQEAV